MKDSRASKNSVKLNMEHVKQNMKCEMWNSKLDMEFWLQGVNICQTKYGMYDAKRCEDTEDQKNGLRQIEINAITEPAGIGSTQQGTQPAGKLVWLNCEEAMNNFYEEKDMTRMKNFEFY